MAYNRNIFSRGTVTYKDLDLSFEAHPFTGDLKTKTDLEAVKQALNNLILTNFGERPFRPHIGAGLNNLLFQPLDQLTRIELDAALRRVIGNWEPRINIISLVIGGEIDANEITVSLLFNMLNLAEPSRINIILSRVR